MQEKFYSVVSLTVLCVVGLGIMGFVASKALSLGSVGSFGTDITYNAQNDSYTEGADFRQNVQAMAERMSGLTAGQFLQANSSGHMEAVSTLDNLVFLENTEAITASNTISLAEAGKTFYLSGATSTQTLPATSTSEGAVYRFVVGGSVTGNITIVTSDGGNDIEGSLIVAGAVVDCASEDTITIVADGENIGDFVELRSNGTDWLIGASSVLTAGKMTCSAT